ncbi:hypothetical protein CVT24_003140 [Panaeolus cyanescens]|uniref:Uncharacterized protein n=1 Tax=Panaeolus cyanescens TaxID=181874 RepID=A0A409XAH5_9AGAR|nr:hypothetical protein CVT24_003140 [Panaeolus cyanescens]
MAFLWDSAPITSTSPIPPSIAQPAAIPQPSPIDINTISISSPEIIALTSAVRELEHTNRMLVERNLALQASNLLNETYIKRVRSQLEAKEKRAAEGNRNQRLAKNGLPKILTAEEFIKEQREQEEEKKRKDNEAAARKVAQQKLVVEKHRWAVAEEKRLDENYLIDERYNHAVEKWKERRAEAKRLRFKLKDWERENPPPKKQPYIKKRPVPRLADMYPRSEGAPASDVEGSDGSEPFPDANHALLVSEDEEEEDFDA